MFVCPEGLDFLPYQKEGIEWLIDHPMSLLGDEPGVGKTIQTIGLINYLAEFDDVKILILCPASVKGVWLAELKKWATRPMRVTMYKGTNYEVVHQDEKYEMSIHICNYDAILNQPIRKRFIGTSDNRPSWDLLVADECHILRNPDAKSTRFVFGDYQTIGIRQFAKRFVGLSGTPMINRPIDMQVICAAMNPSYFTEDRHYFGRFYCAGHQTRWGWEYKGQSNVERFQQGLSQFMIRRLKKDVLPQMPDKIFQIINLGESRAVRKEQGILQDNNIDLRAGYTDENIEDLELQLDSMSSVRKEIGMEKVTPALQFIRDILENSDEKVVIFAHHKEVIDRLMVGLEYLQAVKLTGETSDTARQEAIDLFQNGYARVFIGNMQAAGVGITLTASSHVIFVELDWIPSVMSQAIDRCHRVGQKNSVLVQFLVFNNSLEEHMANILDKKSNMISKALG